MEKIIILEYKSILNFQVKEETNIIRKHGEKRIIDLWYTAKRPSMHAFAQPLEVIKQNKRNIWINDDQNFLALTKDSLKIPYNWKADFFFF